MKPPNETTDNAVQAAWWSSPGVLYFVRIDLALKRFRTGFIGKNSPVHLFWGAFDIAVTRFSGRRAPLHPGGIPSLPDEITREASSRTRESHPPAPSSRNGSASYCSRTRRCAPRPIRRARCSPSCRAPTRPPRISALGIAALSTARLASRGARGRFEPAQPPRRDGTPAAGGG